MFDPLFHPLLEPRNLEASQIKRLSRPVLVRSVVPVVPQFSISCLMCWLLAKIGYLVGGWATPLKNMKVSWDDDIPNIWKHKKMVETTSNCWILPPDSRWSMWRTKLNHWACHIAPGVCRASTGQSHLFAWYIRSFESHGVAPNHPSHWTMTLYWNLWWLGDPTF